MLISFIVEKHSWEFYILYFFGLSYHLFLGLIEAIIGALKPSDSNGNIVFLKKTRPLPYQV